MKKYYDNGFCTLFMDTYDYYTKEGIFKEEAQEDIENKPKKKFRLFGNKEINNAALINDITKESQYQRLIDIKKSIMEEWFTAKGISFSVLWDFIEFIEFAKRSILYSDKDDRFVSFIKDEDGKEHRHIIITPTEEITFYFDLYYANNIECLKICKVSSNSNIKQVELFIADEKIDFKDEADIYLINTINYILCRECRRKMKIIFESLKEVFII